MIARRGCARTTIATAPITARIRRREEPTTVASTTRPAEAALAVARARDRAAAPDAKRVDAATPARTPRTRSTTQPRRTPRTRPARTPAPRPTPAPRAIAAVEEEAATAA